MKIIIASLILSIGMIVSTYIFIYGNRYEPLERFVILDKWTGERYSTGTGGKIELPD